MLRVTGKWKCSYIDNWFKFENQRDVGIVIWNLLVPTVRCVSYCNYSLGFKAIFSRIFTEFELTTESKKHKKMTCSYNDNYFSERLTFEICHLQLISSYTQICSLQSKKKHGVLLQMYAFGLMDAIIFFCGLFTFFYCRWPWKKVLGTYLCLNLIGKFGTSGSTSREGFPTVVF